MDTFHHEYCFPMCRFTLQHCRFLKQNGSSISLNFVFGRSLSFLFGSGFRCGSREMHFHSINQVVEVNATLPNIRSHTFKDTLALRVLQVLVLLFRANLFVKTRQLAYSVNMCNFSDTQHWIKHFFLAPAKIIAFPVAILPQKVWLHNLGKRNWFVESFI